MDDTGKIGREVLLATERQNERICSVAVSLKSQILKESQCFPVSDNVQASLIKTG